MAAEAAQGPATVTEYIQHTAKGAGKLVVAYNNLDELDGILAHIQ